MTDPINFSKNPDPQAAGIEPQALQPLADLFDRQIADGLHSAAQLVVLKDGHVIFDRTSGTFNGWLVTADTPFYCFSVTKAFTGMCVHKLIEDGKLSLDTPVAEVWPAFGKKGKQAITIRQVFLHLAGIPAISRYDHILFWPFWNLIIRRVASLAPEYPPGSKMSYHAVTYGFILGEVVRRVSGLPIDQFFHKYFAQPLGLINSWLKIPPAELNRSPPILSGCKNQDNLAWLFNLRLIRKALIPAASLHSTAREMAIFYQMLVNYGSYAGLQYLKPETVRQATSLGFRGIDDFSQRETLWGFGFHLGGRPTSEKEDESSFGERSTQLTFGHMGNRSSMAWGDLNHRLVVAFTCNRLLEEDASRQRWISLNNAVWDALGVK
jgi:CubicO group peptidase (beta-lactamase class C family)